MIAKIIIASTLKPIWDPRAYEKFGKSLAGTKKYTVEIIGSGHNIPNDPDIAFHPVNQTGGLIGRLIGQLKILRILLRQKPDLLIITTHELIIPAVIIQLITRCKLIYDIQENYNFNLRYQKIYPIIIRDIMAMYIRLKEVVFSHSFSKFLLAENCYLDEINFLRKQPQKCLVIENKCARIFKLKERQPKDKIKLLLSGTISDLYGASQAIAYYKNLPKGTYEMTIIGHCPDSKLREKLQAEARLLDGLNLHISGEPIPHKKIGAEYTTRTVGLLPYQSNKSIDHKIPSKLFEYMANGIPVLISHNILWDKIIDQYNAGLSIDFNEPLKEDYISIFFNLGKTGNNLDLQSFMWISIENIFLSAIESVLSD